MLQQMLLAVAPRVAVDLVVRTRNCMHEGLELSCGSLEQLQQQVQQLVSTAVQVVVICVLQWLCVGCLPGVAGITGGEWWQGCGLVACGAFVHRGLLCLEQHRQVLAACARCDAANHSCFAVWSLW